MASSSCDTLAHVVRSIFNSNEFFQAWNKKNRHLLVFLTNFLDINPPNPPEVIWRNIIPETTPCIVVFLSVQFLDKFIRVKIWFWLHVLGSGLWGDLWPAINWCALWGVEKTLLVAVKTIRSQECEQKNTTGFNGKLDVNSKYGF